MKRLLTLVLIVAVVLGVFVLGKNAVAKAAVEGITRAATGLEMKIQSLNVGLLSTLLEVRNLKLFNPPVFDRVMFDLAELFVNFDLPAIFKGTAHLEELRLDLNEFVVIKNTDGKLNLEALKPARGGKAAPKETAPQAAAQKPASKGMKIQIDKLVLKVGKVVYKDYSKGAPSVKEFPIRFNQTYNGIKDINLIMPLIVSQLLAQTTISQLANIRVEDMLSGYDLKGVDLRKLGSEKIQEFAAQGQKAVQEYGKKTQEEAAKAIETVKQNINTEEVKQKANEAVQGFKNLLNQATEQTSK